MMHAHSRWCNILYVCKSRNPKIAIRQSFVPLGMEPSQRVGYGLNGRRGGGGGSSLSREHHVPCWADALYLLYDCTQSHGPLSPVLIYLPPPIIHIPRTPMNVADSWNQRKLVSLNWRREPNWHNPSTMCTSQSWAKSTEFQPVCVYHKLNDSKVTLPPWTDRVHMQRKINIKLIEGEVGSQFPDYFQTKSESCSSSWARNVPRAQKDYITS